MQLESVCDQCDEFAVGGLTLRVTDCVPKEALEGIQVTSVPCYFDGVADGSLHSGRGGLEGLCHLGVEYLGDGVGVPYGPPGALPDAAEEPYKD